MSTKVQLPIFILTLTASALGICYLCWRQRRKNYVKVAKVKKLYFFPVKSLKAVEVKEINCTNHGVECFDMRDRMFMLVDKDGKLISQREEPSLVMLKPVVVEKELFIYSTDQSEPLKVQITDDVSPEDNIIECRVHTDLIKAVDCGDIAAAWLQDYLNRSDVRLVRYSPKFPQRVYTGENPFEIAIKNKYQVDFQDLAPFHLMSQSSLEEVNKRVERKISVLNFRPNILFEGSAPFDEDNWKFIKFPDGTKMTDTVPCGRCIMTTNDPETGIMPNREPLTTLRKFRMSKDEFINRATRYSPCLGVDCFLLQPGKVNVGDDIFAVIKKGLFKF